MIWQSTMSPHITFLAVGLPALFTEHNSWPKAHSTITFTLILSFHCIWQIFTLQVSNTTSYTSKWGANWYVHFWYSCTRSKHSNLIKIQYLVRRISLVRYSKSIVVEASYTCTSPLVSFPRPRTSLASIASQKSMHTANYCAIAIQLHHVIPLHCTGSI